MLYSAVGVGAAVGGPDNATDSNYVHYTCVCICMYTVLCIASGAQPERASMLMLRPHPQDLLSNVLAEAVGGSYAR